jgi:carboxymethylenebutenolidase
VSRFAPVTTQRDEQVVIDGDGEMGLRMWVPDAGSGPALLLIQEIWGVGPYIRAVAERLAGAGYVVGAPDVFWRFAPGWEADHDEAGLAASMEQVGNLDPAKAVVDGVAALEHLDGLAETVGRPGVIGFCLGGTLAFGVAAEDSPSLCVSYYGSGVPSMLDRLDDVACPTLFHFGTDDPYIPGEGVEALAEALRDRPSFVLNVEAAGHAFDNHEAPMFHNEAAARAAWSKTMAFLSEHVPVT